MATSVISYYNSEGLAFAYQSPYYGVINKEGETVIPFEYDYIYFSNIFALFNFQVFRAIYQDDFVLINLNGKRSERFDYIYHFDNLNDTFIIAEKEGKKGIINFEGEIVLPIIYENVFIVNPKRIAVKKDGKWRFYNEKEKPLSDFEFKEIEKDIYKRDLYIRKYENLKDYRVHNPKTQKMGFTNKMGKTVIPVNKDTIEEIRGITQTFLKAQHNQLWALFSLKGKQLTPFIYQKIYHFENDELARVCKDGLYGYINEKGEEVIPASFEYAEDFALSSAIVGNSNSYGLIDKQGKWLIPLKYKHLEYSMGQDFSIYIAKNNHLKFGIINDNDEIMCPFDYDEIIREKHDYYLLKKRGVYGLMNKEFKQILNCEFEDIVVINENFLFVKKNRLWALVNSSGEFITELLFSNIDLDNHIREGKIKVKRWGFWGLIDIQGKVILPFQYKNIKGFSENRAVVTTEDNLTGVVDIQGNWVIAPLENFPLVVDSIHPHYSDGCVRITEKDTSTNVIRFHYKNRKGKTVEPVDKYYLSMFLNDMLVVHENYLKELKKSKKNR